MSAHDVESTDRTEDVIIKETHTFDSLLLPKVLLQGLKDAGFKRPSPIQLAAVPLARCGLDLIVQAKSGTGKTLVFSLAILETLQPQIKRPQAIIVAPTREIAAQISDVLTTIGKHVKELKVGTFIGGISLEFDRKTIQNCQVVVGAPGRIRHLMELNIMDVSAVRILVVDEADKVFEANCLTVDVNYIFNNLSRSKQIIACSATYTPELLAFTNRYMKNGSHVTPEGVASSVLVGLKQFVFIVEDHASMIVRLKNKEEACFRILGTLKFDQCVIFSNYISRAESLSHILRAQGWMVTCLTSGQSQEDRLKAVNSLKGHKSRIMVTTDLAARGIDASCVNLIINIDVPKLASTYLHRMGRAGRFGSQGICITLVTEGEDVRNFRSLLAEIESDQLTVGIIPSEVKFSELWTTDVRKLRKLKHFKKVSRIENQENSKNVEEETQQKLEENITVVEETSKEDIATQEGRTTEKVKAENCLSATLDKVVEQEEQKEFRVPLAVCPDSELSSMMDSDSDSSVITLEGETDESGELTKEKFSPYGEWQVVEPKESTQYQKMFDNENDPFYNYVNESIDNDCHFNADDNFESSPYYNYWQNLPASMAQATLNDSYQTTGQRTDWYNLLSNQIQKYTEYARAFRTNIPLSN